MNQPNAPSLPPASRFRVEGVARFDPSTGAPVWISLSENTGRMSAERIALSHRHQTGFDARLILLTWCRTSAMPRQYEVPLTDPTENE